MIQLKVKLKFKSWEKIKLKRMKSTFKFCDKESKTFKQEMLCKQDDLHKSMEVNPLGFILFYVFAVFFIALLFQLTKKTSLISGKKKINNISLTILILIISLSFNLCTYSYS